MFKQNFVKICTEKGLSPTAVCTAIGLSNSTYSQWTEDSVPRQTTLLKLAEYLEVSVDELLNGPQEPTSDITEDTVETIHELCRQHHTNPRDMCKKIGIHDCFTTQYRIAGGSDNTIHIAEEDLQKIADYFEVSIGYLTGTAPKGKAFISPTQSLDLTQRETNLILRYRQKPEMQAAVDKLLGLPDDDEPLIPVYVAARSETNTPDRIEYLTREEAERLKNAPPADFDF